MAIFKLQQIIFTKKFDLIGDELENDLYDIKDSITKYLKDNNVKCIEYSNNPKVSINDVEYTGLFYFKDLKIIVVNGFDDSMKTLINSTTDYNVIDIKEGVDSCIHSFENAIGG